MEADFSGWATKAGLKCSDGRTIMPDAFKHQDTMKVPLVWQHGHNDPKNVLGHVLLENRKEGVYAYGFFNETEEGKHAKASVEHGDINRMSIWAGDLIERAKMVLHGAIREVSLVLAGANPGALIENVNIRHGDDITTLDDEVYIYSGETFEHSETFTVPENKLEEEPEPQVQHADDNGDGGDDETIQDVYDSMTDKQKDVLHYMIGQALESASTVEHSAIEVDDENVAAIIESMTDEQKEVLHTMVGKALESVEAATPNNDPQKGNDVNVFEQQKGATGPTITRTVLSHSELEGVFKNAFKTGSLKEAVEQYATEHLAHGINDIETLFPEARTVQDAPELYGRRVEWVASLLGGVTKRPFARIRTMSADITVQEARAKGYIKGSMKKEEFFGVKARVTLPQTIYKKQKLDRDDILDITDFDIVVWLKAEMRIMLDEEIGRAILVGDGRAVDDEDKIREENIRPVASDHELYTTTINVNLSDENSSMQEALDQLVLNRSSYRGSGLPTLFTTERYIARIVLLRDLQGRKIYKNLEEAATDLRFKEIVAVEVLEEYPDILGVVFNPVDYSVGTDRGGQVAMFDDFDIDFNQYKYLIETRLSGALTKLKSALVVRVTNADAVLVVPAEPGFDGSAITIVDQPGVVYRNAATDVVMNAAGSPYPVAEGVTVTVTAEASDPADYFFQTSNDDEWSFTGE